MKVYGIGIDLEEVSTFRTRSLKKDGAFFRRLFSEREVAYCDKFRDPAPHYTARFCAKEAMVKAARSVFPLQVTDVEVANTKDGAPYFLARSTKKGLQKFFKKFHSKLSLSHTKEYAVAMVVLEKGKEKGKEKSIPQ